jgi:hypothetical protein
MKSTDSKSIYGEPVPLAGLFNLSTPKQCEFLNASVISSELKFLNL